MSPEEAKALWASHNVHDYELDVDAGGFWYRSTFLIVVSNDNVVKVIDHREERTDRDVPWHFQHRGSVDSLFSYLDDLRLWSARESRASEPGAGSDGHTPPDSLPPWRDPVQCLPWQMSITYDSLYGFPAYVHLVNPGISDSEWQYTVLTFKPR
jgi:hypothetical protein